MDESVRIGIYLKCRKCGAVCVDLIFRGAAIFFHLGDMMVNDIDMGFS